MLIVKRNVIVAGIALIGLTGTAVVVDDVRLILTDVNVSFVVVRRLFPVRFTEEKQRGVELDISRRAVRTVTQPRPCRRSGPDAGSPLFREGHWRESSSVGLCETDRRDPRSALERTAHAIVLETFAG